MPPLKPSCREARTGAAEGAPDEALAQAARQGSQIAYTVLMQRYRSYAYAYAYSRLHNREEAEDVVQETLLRAYETLPRFRTDACWGAWLMQILRNRCRDILRRRRTRPTEAIPSECRDPKQTPEGWVLTKAERQQMRDALDSLPEKYREVVGMHYASGQKSREIALALGLPETTVKGRLVSALRLLRRRLEHEDRWAHV